MEVKTVGGIDIFCLPDCAVCKLSGKSPFDMEQCPLDFCSSEDEEEFYNNDRPHICYPEICSEYCEIWEE